MEYLNSSLFLLQIVLPQSCWEEMLWFYLFQGVYEPTEDSAFFTGLFVYKGEEERCLGGSFFRFFPFFSHPPSGNISHRLLSFGHLPLLSCTSIVLVELRPCLSSQWFLHSLKTGVTRTFPRVTAQDVFQEDTAKILWQCSSWVLHIWFSNVPC